MDRLVKPDVKEVVLIFDKSNEKCTATFKLTNLMHAMTVAVSLTTTNPSSPFSIDIPFSTISPLSSSTYTLSLSHLFLDNKKPLVSAAPEAIAVVTSMLLAGKSNDCDDLRRLFSKPGPNVFHDAIIPVSIVGPDFAEFLISNHIPRSRPLLKKAISRCVQSQLTDLLTYAVECGNAESVAVLIDAGADSNSKDSNGRSLVPLAIRAGNEMEVVKVLLASGCVIENKVDLVLHEAAAANRVDLMRLLLEFLDDADVDSVNHEGRTPIHVAAFHGHVDVIRYCVSMGGNPNVADRKGWMPLHCAASEGQLGSVESLLWECGCDAKRVLDREGKTAFAIAMENGHVELGDLLHWGDVLFRAARVGDVHGMASCLTVGGADVNGRDQNGWTALHWAALKGKVKSVEVLLDNGAEIDPLDEYGCTPLRCAVESGHLQVALFLVARGSRATLDNTKAFKGLVAPPRLFDSFGRLNKTCGVSE